MTQRARDLRQEYGANDVDSLPYIPTATSDPRVSSMTLANVAATCNATLATG